MAITTKAFWLTILLLAVCVGICTSWGEHAADVDKAKEEEIERGCAETMLYAREKAQCIADSLSGKCNQDKEDAEQKNAAGDVASGVFDHDSHKQDDARTKAYDKTAEAYNEVDQHIRMPTDTASTLSHSESVDHGTERAAESYEQAKQKVSETFVSAKETMTEEAKAKYEDAKEKASQATGDLGAKMRTSNSLELR